MTKFTKLVIVNSITFVRVIGTILLLTLFDKLGGFTIGMIALFIYATDILDGVLARYWRVSTFFGALLDGVADKLFTIVNFIVLYLIVKDIALIPIIIEILIILVQLIKYKLNMNIQSNLIGKLKIWILATSVVLTYFASDIENIKFLSESFIANINQISQPTLYQFTLAPAIIFEIMTLISYVLEITINKNLEAATKPKSKMTKKKLKVKERKKYLKNVWFNPEFYYEHKDETNLKDLRIKSKNEIN